MTVTLHLKPDVEAGLLAQAQAQGMGIEDYLLSLVSEFAGSHAKPQQSPSAAEDAVRKMLEFGTRHQLSLDCTIDRGLLHEGHRF